MSAPIDNSNRLIHDLSHTRINNIYKSMKSRCYNENNNRYYRYGKIGISVCDEWIGKDGFINFYQWSIENGYSDNLTIDRKDNTCNYSPDNCRWVGYKIQENNKSNNRMITCNNVSHTLGEWSEITGIKLSTIWARLNYGWSEEKAILTPLRKKSM